MEEVSISVPEVASPLDTLMGKPVKELTPEENKKYQILRPHKIALCKEATRESCELQVELNSRTNEEQRLGNPLREDKAIPTSAKCVTTWQWKQPPFTCRNMANRDFPPLKASSAAKRFSLAICKGNRILATRTTCIRDLAAGEKNGRLGNHPDLNPLVPPPKQQ
jgi:hypothetical protein